jgi:hypothetical protein
MYAAIGSSRTFAVTRMDQSETLRAYLLGLLPENDAARLEESYFTDPTLADEVAAAEDDLLDDYVRGQLSSEERRSFETHYLASSEHRDRVRLAEAFHTAHAEGLRAAGGPVQMGITALPWSKRPSRVLGVLPREARWLAAAAALVLVIVWSLRAFVFERGVNDIPRQAESGTSPRQDQPAPPASPPQPLSPTESSPPVPPRRATFVLAQVLTRSNVVRGTFDVPAGVDEIELQFPRDLTISPEALVEIQTPDERLIWRGAVDRGSPASVEAARTVVPQAALPSGDYLVLVRAAAAGDVSARYSMRIARR